MNNINGLIKDIEKVFLETHQIGIIGIFQLLKYENK